MHLYCTYVCLLYSINIVFVCFAEDIFWIEMTVEKSSSTHQEMKYIQLTVI